MKERSSRAHSAYADARAPFATFCFHHIKYVDGIKMDYYDIKSLCNNIVVYVEWDSAMIVVVPENIYIFEYPDVVKINGLTITYQPDVNVLRQKHMYGIKSIIYEYLDDLYYSELIQQVKIYMDFEFANIDEEISLFRLFEERTRLRRIAYEHEHISLREQIVLAYANAAIEMQNQALYLGDDEPILLEDLLLLERPLIDRNLIQHLERIAFKRTLDG